MSTALGRRIEIRGIVQGVGFRPWVYRAGAEDGLTGRVRNDATGVTIDAFGSERGARRFMRPARGVAAAGRRDRRRSALARSRRAGRHVHRSFTARQTAERRSLDSAGSRDLSGVPRRDLRSGQPPLPLSVHQLHELRAALHHRARRAVRPAGDDDGARSRCARPASASTTTPAIGASTRSRTPVPACGPRLDAARRRRRASSSGAIRSRRRRGARARRASSRSRGSAGSTWPATRPSPTPCARLRARKRRDEKPFAVMVADLREAEAARGADRRRARAADVGRAADRARAAGAPDCAARRRGRAATTRSSA